MPIRFSTLAILAFLFLLMLLTNLGNVQVRVLAWEYEVSLAVIITLSSLFGLIVGMYYYSIWKSVGQAISGQKAAKKEKKHSRKNRNSE